MTFGEDLGPLLSPIPQLLERYQRKRFSIKIKPYHTVQVRGNFSCSKYTVFLKILQTLQTWQSLKVVFPRMKMTVPQPGGGTRLQSNFCYMCIPFQTAKEEVRRMEIPSFHLQGFCFVCSFMIFCSFTVLSKLHMSSIHCSCCYLFPNKNIPLFALVAGKTNKQKKADQF